MIDIPENIKNYIAGHFDGEGSICLRNNGSVTICVSHTHMPTLALYQELFGGGIYLKKPRVGQLGRRPCWMWQITKNIDVARFLLVVGPYLREKSGLYKAACSRIILRLNSKN